MAKDTSSPPPSVAELNACVSTSNGHHHRPAVKETTFREWMVANQIGTILFISESMQLKKKKNKKEFN